MHPDLFEDMDPVSQSLEGFVALSRGHRLSGEPGTYRKVVEICCSFQRGICTSRLSHSQTRCDIPANTRSVASRTGIGTTPEFAGLPALQDPRLGIVRDLSRWQSLAKFGRARDASGRGPRKEA